MTTPIVYFVTQTALHGGRPRILGTDLALVIEEARHCFLPDQVVQFWQVEGWREGHYPAEVTVPSNAVRLMLPQPFRQHSLCARKACREPDADWVHSQDHRLYCQSCAWKILEANPDYPDLIIRPVAIDDKYLR